jgi:hypothetical protein
MTGEPKLEVRLVQQVGEPTACLVLMNDVVVFDGVDRSVLLREEKRHEDATDAR